MSFELLQERLSALQDTTTQIEELISRLANLKFQPGSIPLDSDEGDVSKELSSEIYQSLKEQAEDLELLEQEVQDLPGGRNGSQRAQDKVFLISLISRASHGLKVARASFRQAQLTAKFNLEEAQRTERNLLISSLVATASSPESSTSFQYLPTRRQKAAPLTKEEKMLNASSDVTLALRRTHNLMASELSRSQFAHDTLKESTAALSQLSESYSILDTMLLSSRTLLGTLMKSQKTDTWYLETAFFILVATVGWLIFRRFIYGPAWWLVYLPLKMFYKAWMGVFVAVGLRSSSDGVFSTATVLTTEILPTTTVRAHIMRTEAPSIAGEPTPRESPPPNGEGSLVEEVGQIIDESRGGSQTADQQPEAAQGEGPNDHPPEKFQRNPMKRMWEEDKEVEKYEEAQRQKQKQKDEL